MSARAASVVDLPLLTGFLDQTLRDPACVLGTILPAPLAADALASWPRLLPGLIGLRSRLRAYVEEQQGRIRGAALVYEGQRPEWMILVLAAHPDPAGADGAFRLLSYISASAARRGMHRLFGSVPDATRSRETFFQAGFYSYTRETWYVSGPTALGAPSAGIAARSARSVDAHDLFRFYAATTPHAVQRAEQLSVQDFDVSRPGGAFDPPRLVGGNPFSLRRGVTLLEASADRPLGIAAAYRGLDRHPHVLKVRTAEGDTALARELLRRAARDLRADRPLAAPVRSYEEHVARALLSEGFGESATAMLFVKELAVRIEEPALAPVVVR